VDLLALVLQKNWPAVKKLIEEEKKVETVALLETVKDEGHEHKGANVLWLLAHHQQWPLIQVLIEQKQVTRAVLASQLATGVGQGRNVFWILAAGQQWPLIQVLIEQKQVTTAILASQRAGVELSINTLWLLANHRQWSLIQALVEQKQVTTALLTSQAMAGDEQGKNVCWFLAAGQQWPLLKILIDQKQVTAAVLSSQAAAGVDQGINAFWFLANHRQWPLIQALIEQKQVTTASLTGQVATGINQGTNAFWFLAASQQWSLIQALIEQKQVTTAVLASQAAAGPNQGINTLLLLAAGQQWPLIQALIEQKQITTRLLLSKRQQGANAGLNVLTHFTQHGQWDLIESLIPEINTQLLLEEPAPNTSLLERLLVQGPDRGVEFFKLLLDAPLNPLAGVPWEAFATKTNAVMVALLQRGDSVTFVRLAELGVALPPPQDPGARAAMSQLSLNKDVVAFSQIVEVYKQYYPQPADKKMEYPGRRILTPDNPLIPDVKDVKPEAQNTYWHWVALETMKEQAEIFGCYRSEMKSHAQARNQQFPEPIMELIQFYAAGDQQGVPYLFENEHASAFTQPEAANSVVKNSQHQTFFKTHQKKGEEAYQAAAAAGKMVGYFDGKQSPDLAAASPKEREKEKEKADEASASSVESSLMKQEQANDESVSSKTESSSSSSSVSPMDTSELSSSSNSSFLKVS
jgi:hypothetical protein